jgi:hypothetical protein
MQNRLVLLATLTGLYIFVIRKIYALLPLFSSGDTSLLVPRISWGVPQTWVPYVVGVIAILGLLSRWGWAWWLTLVALAVEVAFFVPRAILWDGFTWFTLATWIKLGWLAAIAWLLLRTRWLGGIGPGPRARAAR